MRTPLDVRRATFFKPTEEHRKTRQLASVDGGLPLANFVRSSDLTQAFPLTTGTFNQVVKDRNRSPPERRAFSPAGSINESCRPRNLLKISFCLRASQLPDCTGFPHQIRRSSLVIRRPQIPVWPTTNGERPTTAFRAAKRIFLPAPAPNLENNSQFRHEPRRKMIG
jgi:hypothetical protein